MQAGLCNTRSSRVVFSHDGSSSCSASAERFNVNGIAPQDSETWEVELKQSLPLLGHRNWIVVADSAYPAHSNPGFQTIATATDHMDVLEKTLTAIQGCRHIYAKVNVDAELRFLSEGDAPGVLEYRRGLDRILNGRKILELDHEKIIAKLDACGRLFRILILKSTLAIPYTSVFLELDCRYWNSDAERRLRACLTNQS
jgi:hypothetical protein